MLSKFWMPLDMFTKLAMEGLVRGDKEIAPGPAADAMERFEKGKLEEIAKTAAPVT